MTGSSQSRGLAELEERVQRALVTGDERQIEVLGYGEISCVVEWHQGGSAFAAKRLPLFDSPARFETYRGVFEDYLRALVDARIRVVPSRLESTPAVDGNIAVWCLQPLLSPNTMAPNWLQKADTDQARWLLERISDHIVSAVGPALGVDGQLSNWAVVDGEVVYFDITTPMMRDDTGRDLLDIDLFVASMPWVLRGLVRRFALRAILDTYYRPRQVLVDLLGNFIKEGVADRLALGLEVANQRVEPAIDEAEVRRYYLWDARMYAALQRLRRLDRAWQRRVRGRPYTFLLPGEVQRRV